MEAFGNTLHCRVEINFDKLTCIHCFKFLLVRSLCVGATASLNWFCYYHGKGGLCWSIGVFDHLRYHGGRGGYGEGVFSWVSEIALGNMV